MSKKTIWEYLKANNFSDVACAAIMGNMEAESNCVSYRLQGDFSTGFQKSVEYTGKVDRNEISKEQFVYYGPGGGGYGLCQWTYQTRKAGLYDLAKSRGVSIGDEATQIDWLVEELRQDEFRKVLNILQISESIRECSDSLIKNFLRPFDQSEAVCIHRAQLGVDFYNEFSEKHSGQTVEITENEYETFTRAMLVVMYLKDIMNALQEFDLE